MQQNTVTLIVAGLGIFGTLGGTVIGHLLTRSWQQKQWLLDCRKEEFRELMSALTKALMVYSTPGAPPLDVMDAQVRAIEVLKDRIFVASDVRRLKLFDLWVDAAEKYAMQKDGKALTEGYEKIRDLLIEAAIGKV
jgi:hypothetical protein